MNPQDAEPREARSAEDGQELLLRWRVGIRTLHIGHNLAGEAFDKWARVTGVASAVIGSIVGTAIFASLAASTRVEIRIATGVASLVAAGLSTAQLIWNYPQLAQRHKCAAVKYGTLRRRTEEILAGPPASSATLQDVSRIWEQVEDIAPPLPERFRRRARYMMDVADRKMIGPQPAAKTGPPNNRPANLPKP
ncbi:SLATT domain-containing protein [Micromonospora inositola]|uniref:SLATT domain-containing protein n=1 Tax=Micromonospora inositola TaxID=47865 RepID=UPI0012FD5EBA|nr:SLATT domain-containing protein [Micromonospora inositola]